MMDKGWLLFNCRKTSSDASDGAAFVLVGLNDGRPPSPRASQDRTPDKSSTSRLPLQSRERGRFRLEIPESRKLHEIARTQHTAGFSLLASYVILDTYKEPLNTLQKINREHSVLAFKD